MLEAVRNWGWRRSLSPSGERSTYFSPHSVSKAGYTDNGAKPDPAAKDRR